jgi:hypothetical protein
MGSMMSVKGGIISSCGRLSLIASTVFLLLLFWMKKSSAVTVVSHLIFNPWNKSGG